MAELLTLQDLANGHLDVKALGEAANGDENTIVTTRTGNTYPSAERAINIMFQNGGLPAVPFPTKAKMITDGASLPDDSYAMVTNEKGVDAINNGLYTKAAGAWVKSAYEPVLKDKLGTEIASSINAASTVNMSLDDGQKLYVEQAKKTARTLYINVPRFYLAKGSKASGSYYTWSNIKADLNDPSLFVTSARGYPDCLALNDNSLVLGIADNKFYLVPRGSVKPSEHIVIASAIFGQLVGGELLPIWLNKTATRSKPLLYPTVPNELPYVEKSGNSIYIKVTDLQIRLSQDYTSKSWAQLKTDVNDPSLFLTSPLGVADCLVLNNSILVFNDDTNKYKVINELNAKNDAETLIARAYNGELVDGLLFEIYARRKNTSTAQSTVNKDIVGSKQRYVAHGGLNGANMLAPYNTLPAVRLAGEYGYWGVETDLVETKDGEWVHCHDLFLNDYVYATGNVADYTLAELKQMDASKKSAVFGWTNVPIMELSEFLKVCVEYNLVPIMEFKSVPTSSGVDKVFDIIKTHTTLDKVALTSFSLPVLQLIRSKSASVQLWLSINVVTTSSINSVLSLGNAVLAASKETPFAKIQESVAAGVKVARYTLSPDDIKNGFSDKSSYIVTDYATPYDMQKGHTGLIFNNKPDFSNLTTVGAGVSTNGILNLPSGAAYLDVPAKKGDVITVSFEARKTGTGLENPTVDIRLYKVDTALLTVYTTQKVTKDTFDVYTLSSVVRDSSFGTARIFISAAADSGIELRGLKVKRLEF